MKLLEITLLINNVLWCASVIFLIYAAGVSILTLNIQMFVMGVILLAFATFAELILAILND
jgi:hypothetical protein